MIPVARRPLFFMLMTLVFRTSLAAGDMPGNTPYSRPVRAAISDDAHILKKLVEEKPLENEEKEHVFRLSEKWGREGRLLRRAASGDRLSSSELTRLKNLREDWLLSEKDPTILREITKRHSSPETPHGSIKSARTRPGRLPDSIGDRAIGVQAAFIVAVSAVLFVSVTTGVLVKRMLQARYAEDKKLDQYYNERTP